MKLIKKVIQNLLVYLGFAYKHEVDGFCMFCMRKFYSRNRDRSKRFVIPHITTYDIKVKEVDYVYSGQELGMVEEVFTDITVLRKAAYLCEDDWGLLDIENRKFFYKKGFKKDKIKKSDSHHYEIMKRVLFGE